MIERAVFGAGCFWGVEEAFKKVPGVVSTRCGYSGGQTSDPSYEDVCSGQTGHAEVVEVGFDSEKVSYEKLLEVFWTIHDPTTLNRQGPDIGTQYRSVIFFETSQQEALAHRSRANAQLKNPGQQIVTEIAAASEFYEAEEYHQCYLEKKGLSSCK